MSDTDTHTLPQMLESAGKAYAGAELEASLLAALRRQVEAESTGLDDTLAHHARQLDGLDLKALRGAADAQLLALRGALAKLKKPGLPAQRRAELQEALAVIAAARARCADLDVMVAQGATLLDDVKKLREQCDLWDKDSLRYALRDELDGVRRLAALALEQAGAGDIHLALQTCAQAQALKLDGTVKKKMAANQVPDTAEIASIIGRKDGDRQLDAMIENLDESTQRQVVRAAFEARFGCKLQMLDVGSYDPVDPMKLVRDGSNDGVAVTPLENKKSADLRRFYKVMSKLPASHTRDNDKLKKFRYRDVDAPGRSPSWAHSGPGYEEVVMNDGRADKSVIYGCGRADEMPEDVPDECRPANDEAIIHFDWNTAHEVGHTLDAKLGFMGRRSNQSAFGGWRQYADSSEVAEALIQHYDFDPAYVRNLLAGTPAVDPPAPMGTDPVEWARRKTLVDAHHVRMQAVNSPWASQATAQSLAINGRVYQQSYDASSWSSYELAARRLAITGYQFRSPLEWFSELYAAYKVKKLKPGHPAMEWLQRLDGQ